MKPRFASATPWAFGIVILAACITLVSWNYKNPGGEFRKGSGLDTVPKTKQADREKKVRDLDDVLDELNNAEMKVNMEKVQQEITEAMKKIDGDKIKMEIDKAMKEVDMEKISRQVAESMAAIDWDKMTREMEEVKKLDLENMKADMKRVQEEMKKIGPRLEKEMTEMKKINFDKMNTEMERVKEELKNRGPKLEKEMEKARVSIENAKTEMKEYRDFVNGLEKDGLINKKGAYTIQHKDGELTVNGKKVSADLYSKYQDFLEKHKTFKIEKSDDNFNIDTD